MTTIYISGKISGVPSLNWRKFKDAEIILKNMRQYKVLNPHNFEQQHDKKWSSYMRVCITQLMGCDELAALDDWQNSRGAIIEVMLAKVLGIKVYDCHDLLCGRQTTVIINGRRAVWLFIKVLLNRF